MRSVLAAVVVVLAVAGGAAPADAALTHNWHRAYRLAHAFAAQAADIWGGDHPRAGCLITHNPRKRHIYCDYSFDYPTADSPDGFCYGDFVVQFARRGGGYSKRYTGPHCI